MKAVLRCDLTEEGRPWDTGLLKRPVTGVPLLQRHLLALREAGLRQVEIRTHPDDRAVSEIVSKLHMPELEIALSQNPGPASGAALELRADTLVDPRLVQQIATMGNGASKVLGNGSLRCVDRYSGNYPVEAKSPYHVGVPEKEEATRLEAAPTDETLHPIGLDLKSGEDKAAALVDVGRFYWHRLKTPADFKTAGWKVLLATMKATDGIYAKTNRRVSLRISQLLSKTPVTPNMVTVFTFFCSLAAGFLYAGATYWTMLAGGFVSWVASMLDGVDGELARAKFQASDFGCWLEMVCDYLYYVFVFTGMGYGVMVQSGNPLWLYLGVGSAAGSVLGFAVVAHQRKLYSAQGDAGEYGLAFQQKVGRQAKSNPVYAATRKLTFLATRAALPYYIFIFTALGLVKVLLGFIAFGTALACFFAAYVTRLFRVPAAK